MLLTVAVLIQLNMKQRTISMLTSFLSIAFLFGLASSKPTQTSTGNYIHGTDIVTEILQAIDRREEMWKITSYLNASRDELSKELPLVNPDGTKINYTFFAPTSMAFMVQTPQNASDPMLTDANFRLKVLIRHFVRQHVSTEDLTKLSKLVMADSTEVAITRKSKVEVCNLPPIANKNTAACLAYFPSWTFNTKSGKCQEYVYGGCHKTENLYETEKDCLNKCGPVINTVKSYINQAEIQTEACACSEHVHEFCTIFVVDSVFMTKNEVADVLSKHPPTDPKAPYSTCDRKLSDVAVADEPSHTHNGALRTTPLDPISPILVDYISVSPSEADVQEIAQFAVDELSRGAHSMASPLVLVSVVKAEKQTLAGVNYRLKLKLKSGDVGAIECDVVVFDQSCSSTCRVSSFKCNPPLDSNVSSKKE